MLSSEHSPLNTHPASFFVQTLVTCSRLDHVEKQFFYLRWKKPDGLVGAAVSMFAWFL